MISSVVSHSEGEEGEVLYSPQTSVHKNPGRGREEGAPMPKGRVSGLFLGFHGVALEYQP